MSFPVVGPQPVEGHVDGEDPVSAVTQAVPRVST